MLFNITFTTSGVSSISISTIFILNDTNHKKIKLEFSFREVGKKNSEQTIKII
jgi:hypothetical protein